MSAAGLRLSPERCLLPRVASTLFAACVLLLPAGCNLPMSKLAENGPPAPGPLSSGASPRLYLAPADSTSESSTSTSSARNISLVRHTVHHPGEAGGAIAPKEIAVDLDAVLWLACEHNARILLARERINESQAAFDAAVNSCLPQLLRKDTFKRPVAEAQLWQRRAELSKVQYEVLQDVADTYFDWLTARRGEAIALDLQRYEEKLLKRSQALVDSGEKTAQLLVEAVLTFVNVRRQFIARTHQLGDAAAIKLAYLLGMSDGVPAPSEEGLTPIDIVDAGVPAESLVQQSQENGPGVRELQGLAVAIQTGINDAQCAQRICHRTGAAMVCGRLRMADSQLHQAQLALVDVQGKLRAGVEEGRSAILSGRDQIAEGANSIQHAAETYRILNLRLESESLRDSMSKNTYNTVLASIQQLAQGHASYLSAVRAYNKAQVRLLLLIGTYNDCQAKAH